MPSSRIDARESGMLMQLVIGFLITVLSSCLSTPTLSVEEILDNIEKSDVSSVTADVYYSRTDPILERKEIRTGKIIFRTSDDNTREAAILFDTRIIGRRREDRQKHYIFYTEKMPISRCMYPVSGSWTE